MSFLDSILGRSKDDDWTPTHRALLKEVTYDELASALGRPKKAKGGYVYWRGELEDLDPNYPEGVFYQISNKDYRFGEASKKPRIDRETWFLATNGAVAVRLIADEVGAIGRNIEAV